MTVNFSNNDLVPLSDSKSTDEEIKELLKQNLELTKEIHEMTHKIKNYITFQKVMSFIYILLIVGPIILSFIYLPTILSGYLGQYKDVLGGSGIDPTVLKEVQNTSPSGILEMLKGK